MNKQFMFLLAAFLVVSIISGCLAETYTYKTGSFKIQVESNESVEFESLSPPVAEDNYNAYEVTIYIGGSGSLYPAGLEIQDYGRTTKIDLMNALLAYCSGWFVPTSTESLEIGGKPGTMFIRDKVGETETGAKMGIGFVAAYSPDGYGDLGSIIAVIDRNSGKEKTFKDDEDQFKYLVKNLRISRES